MFSARFGNGMLRSLEWRGDTASVSIEIDLEGFRLLKDGSQLPVEPKALNLLIFLVENRGKLVERQKLIDAVWGEAFVTDHVLNRSIGQLRKLLEDDSKVPRYIETVPTRGYRFIADVELEGPEEAKGSEPTRPAEGVPTSSNPTLKSARWGAVAAATVLVIGLAVGGSLFLTRKAHALTDKDTIVLAEFENTTGDAVFDGTLRQGLSVQLEQSPFLSIISDQQIQQTLQMMGKKPDAKLTPEIARELCQRTGSAADLEGSIAQIGTQYLLTLRAVNCVSGATLASTEARASDKNHVLDALGNAASTFGTN